MNESDIFVEAIEIDDVQQRAEYLSHACNCDQALRRKVEALLAAHERSGAFLDVPVLRQMAGDNDLDRTDGAGDQREVDLSFLQPSSKTDSLGRLLHYEVQEVVGQGGCGIVLKAFDEKLHRVVAIKVMAPQLAATSPARKRFLREARATAAIRHENVVSIHAVEEHPLPFLVMEYIDGQTLQDMILQIGPLEIHDIISIGQQIARGLQAAHVRGLIHRDIKPANILLESGTGRPKITDFGLARSADDASLTQSGTIAGTPLYMSPEQAQGLETDPRSDLFSLGSVLYVMCSGRPPFRASTAIAVLKRVVDEEPRPIRDIIPEVPVWLASIVSRLHAKDAAKRFSSAGEVADMLTRSFSQQQVGAHTNATRPPSAHAQPLLATALAQDPIYARSPFVLRRRWPIAAGLLMALMFGGMGLTEAAGVTDFKSTIIRLFSSDGSLIVTVDDPSVSVSLNGEELVITGSGAREIRLKPGQYHLEASKNGEVIQQELVNVARNGRQAVRVTREVQTPRASTPAMLDPDRKAAEYVLAIGGKLQVDGMPAVISQGDALPTGPFRLTSAFLDYRPATSAGLENFRGTRHLVDLRLDGISLTDEELSLFRDNRNLRHLQITSPVMTGAGLTHFKECSSLRVLWLNYSRVGDDDMAVLKGHQQLTLLGLVNSNVGSRGLAALAHHPSLIQAELLGTKITDGGLAVVKTWPKIGLLHLDHTAITDAGLADLADCKTLEDLALSETAVTDAGLMHLAGLDRLKALNLLKTKVTAEGVQKLHSILPMCNITWDGGTAGPSQP